jgi:lipoprotein signal peptidase
MIKSFTNNGVTYGYSRQSKKWEFHVEALKHTALLSLARAQDKIKTATAISNILAGAVKRGGIDNLARKNIENLLARAE